MVVNFRPLLSRGLRVADCIERRRVVAVLPAVASILVNGASYAAQAQTPATGPGGLDYGAVTTTFGTAIQPIMTTALPAGLVIMGVWMAPGLLKKIIRKFAG